MCTLLPPAFGTRMPVQGASKAPKEISRHGRSNGAKVTPTSVSREISRARRVQRGASSDPARAAARALATVRTASRESAGSIYLGHGARGWAWAGREHSTLVLGPSRSGKTSCLVIPNVLSAPGAVVTTSTKDDVLRATSPARNAAGWCLLFDPSGTVDEPRGVHRVGWSPVAASRDWGAAIEIADAMVRTARGRPFGSVGSGIDGHWTERAAALLAPLMHAAALDGASVRTLLHWVDRHDGSRALEVLTARCGDGGVATDVLAGILTTDDRELSGIWSTTSGVLAAYRSPGALASTEGPLLDPDAFCAGPHSLYVCAAGAQQQLLAPLVVGMMTQLRDAAYRRARTSGRAASQPVLFALDEVANIAPLPDLPSIVTEGPGQGLLTLACLQDLSQARARWGPGADAFLSIFATSVVLGGIADIPTLEALSALGGDRELRSRTVGWSEGPGGRQVSATDGVAIRRRLPVDVIARGAPGWALSVDARKRLGWVGLTPAYASWPWRECLGGELDRPLDRAAREWVARAGRER